MREECFYEFYDTKENLYFDSKVVHGALGCDPITGAVSFPIFQSATFRHKSFDVSTGYNYTRLQNPTRQELERTMAILEEGAEGFAFSSGQAANMAVFGMLKPGEHVILSDDIYGGTFRICEEIFRNINCDFTYLDMADLAGLEEAIRPNTRILFVETPTNPMMKVADINAISEVAKRHGLLLVVDNTFLTPYFQRPLTQGADIVVHSGTKYLCGHNDVLAGIVVVRQPDLAAHFRLQLKSRGSGLSPFESWLLIRGIKTLSLRMEKHDKNAKAVVEWLKTAEKVKKLYYAGIGGMISFELDSVETVHHLLESTNMIMFAESLGGTETLITYPLTQTHESIPEDIRQKLGINERFVRISVGIEDVRDIIADLEQALR